MLPAAPLPYPLPARAGGIRVRRVVFVVLIAAILVVMLVGIGRVCARRSCAPSARRRLRPAGAGGPGRLARLLGGVYALTAGGDLVITTTGNAPTPATQSRCRTVDASWARRRVDRTGSPATGPARTAAPPRTWRTSRWSPRSSPGPPRQIDLGRGLPGDPGRGEGPLVPGGQDGRPRRDQCPGRLPARHRHRPAGQERLPRGRHLLPCTSGRGHRRHHGQFGRGRACERHPRGGRLALVLRQARVTPLAEGLAEMGLTMCDTPDCGCCGPGRPSLPKRRSISGLQAIGTGHARRG